jgi:hypothetical protein
MPFSICCIKPVARGKNMSFNRNEEDKFSLRASYDNMDLPHAGVDADLALREKIVARTSPIDSWPGLYRAHGQSLTFLNQL